MIRPSGLARLIANENSLSDLWVSLIDVDPTLLAPTLGLPDNEAHTPWRELKVTRGRLDIVIYDSAARPTAVLEMKGASGVHSDQLERYAAWAKTIDPPPSLFFCGFDADEAETPEGWTRLRLRDLFLPWTQSENQHAKWLATEIVHELNKWDTEADGDLGARTGYYVPDIVTKRMARSLLPRLAERGWAEPWTTPTRDVAGSPMLIASVRLPGDDSNLGVRVGVDVRSPVRSRTASWKFRPYIAVLDETDLPRARREAFRVARRLHNVMGATELVDALTARGLEWQAGHLNGGNLDGFQKPAATFDFDGWADRLEGLTGTYPKDGVFGYDRGTRLFTIINLDIQILTREDLEKLIVETVDILATGARQP